LLRRRACVGIECRAQAAHRVMKSRSDRPGRDDERLGDLVERHLELVVEDQHRTMIDGKAPKASLELVALSYKVDTIGTYRLFRSGALVGPSAFTTYGRAGDMSNSIFGATARAAPAGR